MADVLWQPSLLDESVGVDPTFSGLVRHQLDADAWLDHVPGWVSGQEQVFEEVLERGRWQQHSRRMYDKEVDQPRLNASWKRSNGKPFLPVIGEMRDALSERYERDFTSGGLNLYRDGRDSVAWHGDRIPKEVVNPVVGIVSLGAPRTFRLRPKGGGKSLGIVVRGGDLIVTGGTCQRTWEHSVPKVASAAPRISVTFRHGMTD
jgi:alkylated DNA repair dioxygenase AlkB